MVMSPRLLRPVASGFDPRRLGDLVAWYDAADAATLFQNSNGTTPSSANSDPVGHWADKSTAGRNATQGTSGSRPTISTTTQNGRRLLGVASQGMTFSSLALTGDYTAVYAHNPSNSNQFVIGGSTSTHLPSLSNNGASVVTAFFNYDNVFAAVSTGQVASGFQIIFAGRTSGSHFIFKNGTDVTASTPAVNTSTATVTNLFFRNPGGPSAAANGTYGEIMIFNKSLTSSQRTALTNYLRAKWGV
jgi:hypothetical protein